MENQTQNKFSLEIIIRSLPILPMLGFVFALAYEMGYFFALGIPINQIMDLSDIVISSVFKILLGIPFLLFGAWMGLQPEPKKADTSGQKILNFFNIASFYLMKITYVFVGVMFLLFGLMDEIGAAIFISLIIFWISRILLSSSEIECYINRLTRIYIMIFIVFLTIFGVDGYVEASQVLLRKQNELPIVTIRAIENNYKNEKFRLIRRLSNGLLVMSISNNYVLFIQNNNSTIIKFTIDNTRFHGILCASFNWCLGRFNLDRK